GRQPTIISGPLVDPRKRSGHKRRPRQAYPGFHGGRHASNQMIDLHCHVLPAVDDGPATIEAAVELARDAESDGTTTIVATPHFDSNHMHLSAARIAAEVVSLQKRLDSEGVGITVLPGAELSALRAADLDDGSLKELALGSGPWLLLECPL